LDGEEFSNLEDGYIYNYISEFNKEELYSSFYLKEKLEIINNIIDISTIEVKSTVAKIDGQPSLILLFKFANNNKYLYGRAYTNTNRNDREHLEMLLFQKELPLVFVDLDNNIVKTVGILNDFKEDIKTFIKNKRFTSNIELYNLNGKGYKLEDIWLEA
jgi:hypothetical protein